MDDLKKMVEREGGYLLLKGEKLPYSFCSRFYRKISGNFFANWTNELAIKNNFEKQEPCYRKFYFFFQPELKKEKSDRTYDVLRCIIAREDARSHLRHQLEAEQTKDLEATVEMILTNSEL